MNEEYENQNKEEGTALAAPTVAPATKSRSRKTPDPIIKEVEVVKYQVPLLGWIVLGCLLILLFVMGLGLSGFRITNIAATADTTATSGEQNYHPEEMNTKLNAGGFKAGSADPQAGEPAPMSSGTSGNPAVAPASGTSVATCPTTAEAKLMLGIDVQSLETEPCAWIMRSVGIGSADMVANPQFIHTLHLASDQIAVFTGDGMSREVVAMTSRYLPAYNSLDAVHRPCDLLAKEQAFGSSEVPSFPVYAGNFVCDGSSSLPTNAPVPTQVPQLVPTATSPAAVVPPTAVPPVVTTLQCPTFGDVKLTLTNVNGDVFCKYLGEVVTDVVPAGFWVQYWDGKATQTAQAGATITTGEGTFRPQ